ncbi:MAG: hypothetical protein R1F52_02740 [Candidatus Nitrosoabyssus spongiisocia]|nr:MAG: hypothetical protein R1F52_02740 [Nitrosopumilaceae archaeon AB1(1)]
MKKQKFALFNTFKTKSNDLTGEAQRERAIVTILATQNKPDTTRRKISQIIAGDNSWQNVYSGIYHDLDEVLIPQGLVEEGGRLPLKRGPKAMQEHGVSYYKLTLDGMIVALSLRELKDKSSLLKKIFKVSKSEYDEILLLIAKNMPNLISIMFEEYVKEYFAGKFKKLSPLDFNSMDMAQNSIFQICKEIIKGCSDMSNEDRHKLSRMLN